MSAAWRRSATWTTGRSCPRSRRRPVRSGDPLPGNEFIRDHIPGAKLAVLDAAHIANMELPQAYADTVLGFLLN
jgi:hypothetical protein